MGDGACNQGQVYEAFNMASLWKLPAVFVIEDNQYGMGTSTKRASASTEFWRRGEPWDIPGRVVDGMDLFAVREAAEWACDHARSGKGPALLHVKTYRYRGHSMSDPAKYRSKDEVEQMRSEHDPIEQVQAYLLKNKIMTEESLKALEKEVKAQINDSADFAQTSPEPQESELYTDVLIEG